MRKAKPNPDPASDMNTSDAVCSRVRQFIDNDLERAKRRNFVKEEIDGKAPFDTQEMIEAGAAHNINVNTRVAEAYMNQATSIFYDIFSEADSYATVVFEDGPEDQAEEWAQIMTDGFDLAMRQDAKWLSAVQQSHWHMVAYGVGPLVFLDDYDWRNDWIATGDLLVPEYVRSEPDGWDEACILFEYTVNKLYCYIRNPDAAHTSGWKPDNVKKAILEASPRGPLGDVSKQWEWAETQLKNASFQFSGDSETVKAAHYFFREKPRPEDSEGKITHCIVARDNPEIGFLYRREHHFDHWDQIVHPMYYANDGGGFHHSVTGLGTKMYSALQVLNRLYCNAADKAMAPKQMFQPMTQGAEDDWNMASFGDYGRLPANWQAVQTPVGSFLQDPIAGINLFSDLLARNLSSYQMYSQKSGNPITATEANYDFASQSQLNKTQLAHYYDQMDRLYAEKFRRLVYSPSEKLAGGKAAKQFREYCKGKGVPLEAMKRATAKATRMVGQGSQVLRQQALMRLVQMFPYFNDEQGRNNLMRDVIAAFAGRPMVNRYNTGQRPKLHEDEQKSTANLQIASAKVGVPPVVAPNHNPAIFAPLFVKASSDAVQAASQTGDFGMAVGFAQAIAPATTIHLQRLAADPSRKQMADELNQIWQQVGKTVTQMAGEMDRQQQAAAQQQQAAMQAQQMGAGMDPEMMLKAEETKAKIGLQQAKTAAMMDMKAQKHAQDMRTRAQTQAQELALKDASTAADIRLKARKQQQSKSDSDSE